MVIILCFKYGQFFCFALLDLRLEETQDWMDVVQTQLFCVWVFFWNYCSLMEAVIFAESM